MDAIQLGPLLLKKSILVLLFSCLLAYLYIAVYYRKRQDTLKTIEHHLVSTALLWVLVFKFSILLFRPSILWTNPYGLLFFTGGTKGVYLASIMAILFFYWQAHKSNLNIKTTTILVVPVVVIILTSYYLLMYLL
ncbi:hypothetical protein [Sutcliffiella deserti]|uniref:hypothetical protein n=1 Tax=Sutcliffiella deserti TaxID=2875501 RepID=UPI001CBFD305|nr:hypothetical protein [Sutcliffiella deserti]